MNLADEADNRRSLVREGASIKLIECNMPEIVRFYDTENKDIGSNERLLSGSIASL